MIRALARAKINLRLAVVGRRSDGYHELETVMQSISLADELRLAHADHFDVVIRWANGLSGPMPHQPDIVERTMAALRLPGPGRVSISVEKRIPIGAGLGGASADAAAALLGLEKLRNLDPLARLKTEQIAAQLGADVPFCLKGGVALVTGIGDVVHPLQSAAALWWVVGISANALPTVGVYRRFDELSAGIEELPASRGDTAALVSALKEGNLQSIAGNLANDLELAAFDLEPELAAKKQLMREAGALGAIMTGSGSAIIGLCSSESHARRVAGRLDGVFPRVEVVGGTEVGAEVA